MDMFLTIDCTNLQNHLTFHAWERLVNLEGGRECFVGLSKLLVCAVQAEAGYAVCYFLFSGMSLLAVLFVVFITPETKAGGQQ